MDGGEQIVADDIRSRMVELLPRLRRFAFVLTRDMDKANDLVQETCLRALSRADQWHPDARLDSWMYRIAQNIWIDRLRSIKSRGVASDLDSAMDVVGDDGRKVVADRLDLQLVADRMRTLTPDQQMLITLVSIDGLSYKEAAHALDIPIGTVMSRLARARQALAQVLDPSSGTALKAPDLSRSALGVEVAND
jgi:RNA polymerase sigma-70 factor, ECF subfamily